MENAKCKMENEKWGRPSSPADAGTSPWKGEGFCGGRSRPARRAGTGPGQHPRLPRPSPAWRAENIRGDAATRGQAWALPGTARPVAVTGQRARDAPSPACPSPEGGNRWAGPIGAVEVPAAPAPNPGPSPRGRENRGGRAEFVRAAKEVRGRGCGELQRDTESCTRVADDCEKGADVVVESGGVWARGVDSMFLWLSDCVI